MELLTKSLKQKRRVNNPSFLLDFGTPPSVLIVSLSQNSFTYFGVDAAAGTNPPSPPVTSVLSLS